ncbi:set domain protein [Culex quinquefasciatus]|uniref:Set domain protein n=1 Tax=Culex quinquefasciatus TaxID=7176 RepID=B0X8V7_CULQU|nr:set domain protein [Culex quinquefasciatus]|eukprot:XP_001866079.1 set domain protein [Culex quinquefasciatus]
MKSSYQLDRHTGLHRPVHSTSFFVPDVKCIPAGFQLLTTSIMICPKHSLEQCSINVNALPVDPDVVYRRQHKQKDTSVRFFDPHDFGWINRRRIYIYHEGDSDIIDEYKSSDKDPCGLDSNCINRALLVECNSKTFPASESCQNQCFKRKQY